MSRRNIALGIAAVAVTGGVVAWRLGASEPSAPPPAPPSASAPATPHLPAGATETPTGHGWAGLVGKPGEAPLTPPQIGAAARLGPWSPRMDAQTRKAFPRTRVELPGEAGQAPRVIDLTRVIHRVQRGELMNDPRDGAPWGGHTDEARAERAGYFRQYLVNPGGRGPRGGPRAQPSRSSSFGGPPPPADPWRPAAAPSEGVAPAAPPTPPAPSLALPPAAPPVPGAPTPNEVPQGPPPQPVALVVVGERGEWLYVHPDGRRFPLN